MLSLQIFTDSTLTDLLADFTSCIHPPYGGGLRFATNEHGFSSLGAPLVPLGLQAAFLVYDWPGTPHVVVSDEAANIAWEGRLEDVGIVPGGVRLGAFGYWRAYTDLSYTALFSRTGSEDWRPVTSDDITARQPSKYNLDNNNRLYISLKKNEVYSNGLDLGEMCFERPHRTNRSGKDLTITFDYDVTLPTNWQARISAYEDAFSNSVTETTFHTGTGSNSTGSVTETITAGKNIIGIALRNNTGSAYTNTGESDDFYIKVTNIRVRTETTGNVLASDIAAVFPGFINGTNSSQANSSTALVEPTSTDLRDELYEDQMPADIMTRLAALHSYEVGVWENQALHFRAKGSQGRTWYVDVTNILNLERSLEPLRNRAYAIYRAANGRTLRTANSDDAASISRFGLTRRGSVEVDTTDSTEATTHRDIFLNDRKNLSVRADIEFSRLYDETGAEYPLWEIRAGDILTMRNLSPSLSTDIDNIRTFRVGETEYDSIANGIAVTPEEPIPTLVTLVSRRDAGL